MSFKEFGIEISTLRKSKNITQSQLVQDLNISRTTISGLENGTNLNIGFNKVLQIIDYLGYSISLKENSRFPTFEELRDER